MPDDLSVAFERLRTSGQRLNSVSDAAAQLVKDLEEFLESSRIGIVAEVTLGLGADAADAEEPDWEEFLAYVRLPSTGKFRLAVLRRGCSFPHRETIRAWSECSRDDKLASFAHLPELLVELSKRVNAKTDEAERVLTKVAPLLPALKKGGK